MVKRLSKKKQAELASIAEQARSEILAFDPLKTSLIQNALNSELEKLKLVQDTELSALADSFRREVDTRDQKISTLEDNLDKTKKALQKQKDSELLSW